MRVALRVVIVATGVVLGTVLLDWWAVPLVGATWGLLASPKTQPAIIAALGGALGWLLLLGWVAPHGSLPTVATRVGGVLGTGGWGLLALTLAYPLVLSGAGAALGGALRAKLLPGRCS